jgi:hypothetical protein
VHLPNTPLSRDTQVLSAAAAAAVQFPAIHADALAVLLGVVTLPDAVWQLFSQQGLVNPSGPSPLNPSSNLSPGRSPGHTRNDSGSSGLAGEGMGEGAAAARQQQQQQQRFLLLDVRRHDERTLYGAIPGAQHVPGG